LVNHVASILLQVRDFQINAKILGHMLTVEAPVAQACFSSPKLPSYLRVSCCHCRWALHQGRVVVGRSADQAGASKKQQFLMQFHRLCLYGFAGISSSYQRPALGRVEAIAPSKASCKKWRLK
jgi:hypothetical protein